METVELPSVVEVALLIETCRRRNGRAGTEWSELDHIPDHMHPIDKWRIPRAGHLQSAQYMHSPCHLSATRPSHSLCSQRT